MNAVSCGTAIFLLLCTTTLDTCGCEDPTDIDEDNFGGFSEDFEEDLFKDFVDSLSPSHRVHILSLDGGGSRGLMEAIALGHVMDLATLMVFRPGDIVEILGDDRRTLGLVTSNQTQIAFKQAIAKLHPFQPIHPTQAFDYIVGTSTGSLISFGLVGGNINSKGKRVPMTVREVAKMYEDTIPKIFQKAEAKSIGDTVLKTLGSLGGVPLHPYTQSVLKAEVRRRFNGTLTKDVSHGGCLAAAVARQFNEGSEPDILEIFDTESEPEQLVEEVLLGSSAAPIYFEVPTTIGIRNYIDGGVAGNCPLLEALPRVRQLWPEKTVQSVLSLAPPASTTASKMEDIKTQWEKQPVMLKYLIDQSTDGEAVYKRARQNDPDVMFQRLRPQRSWDNIPMDETNVQKMIDAMDFELSHDQDYLYGVVNAAAVIAVRMVHSDRVDDIHIELFDKVSVLMTNREMYEESKYISNQVMERFLGKMRNEADNTGIGYVFNHHIGTNLFEQMQYESAFESYLTAIEYFQDNAVLMNAGNCLVKMGHHERAMEWYLFIKNKNLQREDEVKLKLNMASSQDCAMDEFNELNELKGERIPMELRAYVLNNQANCFLQLGNYSAALEGFKQSLEMKLAINSPVKDSVMTLNNIGITLTQLGEVETSLQLHQMALQNLTANYGPSFKDEIVANTLHILAIHPLTNLSDQAKYLRQALAICRDLFSDLANPLGVGILLTLGINSREQAKGLEPPMKQAVAKKAMEYFFEAIQGQIDLDYSVIEIAKTLNEIGICFMIQDDYNSALQIFSAAKLLLFHDHLTQTAVSERESVIDNITNNEALCHEAIGTVRLLHDMNYWVDVTKICRRRFSGPDVKQQHENNLQWIIPYLDSYGENDWEWLIYGYLLLK